LYQEDVKCAAVCLISAALFFFIGCNSPPVQPGDDQLPENSDDSVSVEEVDEDELLDNFIPPELNLLPLGAELPVTSFTEIWGYVLSGRESALNAQLPVTDVVYFGAEVDAYGKLAEIPNYRNLAAFRGRKHFVAICSSRSLTHFVLLERSPERRALIDDILEAARPYDGLQIDFEYVPARDGEAFLSFLRELRAGLGNKVFSIALPARTRTLAEDVYAYARIKPIVDRIFVMAYDEHWSNSAPGPIASMGWSQRVATYALETIGPEKLIMGLPFYGRSWGDIAPNTAYVYSGIERIIREQDIAEIERENGIPFFRYETPLSMTVYFEDAYSLATRLDMYKKLGVTAVGFWRLGQETLSFWPYIRIE
jgi:spore germination protein YaaH